MHVLSFFVSALMAAAAAQAQTPPVQAPSAPQAQAPAARTQTVCGQPVPVPRTLPPAGSPPVVYQVVPCFEKQGGFPVVEANTYLYYIEMKSRLSNSQTGKWVPYNDSIDQVIREDFKRLWATNFLDDLSIRTEDYVFSNGVVGKMIVYDMEERERVKIVDYEGLKKVDQSKIEEKLKEKSIVIRLDSFIDPGLIRRVTGVVRELYAAEGYQFAEVQPEIKPVEGGPKLVHVTFHVTEGPKVKIEEIDFVGNTAVSDGKLGKKMKENKGKGFFSFITGGGTYKEDKFAEDAQLVTDYYRDEGYIMAQVGQPQMKTLEDSKDGKTRWIQLQVPITEGKKYTVGDFKFEGNKVVNSEALRPFFKLEKGQTYSQKVIKKGIEKAQ
jgi:outer membrane protein insertion porin family